MESCLIVSYSCDGLKTGLGLHKVVILERQQAKKEENYFFFFSEEIRKPEDEADAKRF